MKYLIKATEQYRCDSEKEATELINTAKKDNKYTVVKHSSEIKTLKQKGEIVDEWYRVIITKEFTSEKEPDGFLMPEYLVPTRVDLEEDDLK